MIEKSAARIVETKSGKRGYVYNSDPFIGEKLKVHVIDEIFSPTGEKLLCKPEDLKLIGFKD